MNELYDPELIKKHNDKYNDKKNYHLSYENNSYCIQNFMKSKGDGLYMYAYDINMQE